MNLQLEELACLYVLDRLDAAERTAFAASLRQDPALAAFVHELESTVARSIHALPRLDPPAGLLARIEDRLDRLQAEGPGQEESALRPWSTAAARWGLAALFAVGLGTLLLWPLRRGAAAPERPLVIFVGLDSRRSALAVLPRQNPPPDADASFVQLARLAEQFWEKPETAPARLAATDQPGRGYAVFDPASNQGFIAIRQLPVVEPGKSYHLWILDTASGRVRAAGVLPLTGSSRGLYYFSADPAGGAPAGGFDFFVTAEDAAGSSPDHPRGKVVLGDKRI